MSANIKHLLSSVLTMDVIEFLMKFDVEALNKILEQVRQFAEKIANKTLNQLMSPTKFNSPLSSVF